MNDMKFTKYVVTALAGMMAASMIAGCGGQDKAAAEKKEPLRVATHATFVPFEFKDEANPEDYKGFEMDLIKAVGKEMGREVQINNLPFSGIIPVIQQGDMDIAAAGMTMTQEGLRTSSSPLPSTNRSWLSSLPTAAASRLSTTCRARPSPCRWARPAQATPNRRV